MTSDTVSREMRLEQGFPLYLLRSRELELGAVPELGARIISLRNLRTGREWMWYPEEGLKLFRTRLGEDFSRSPLAGVDECFPTVAPCLWRGRELPDHGELWSGAWRVDEAAWETGLLRTTFRLPISPFNFERIVGLEANQVRMDYRVTNCGETEEAFLWSLHPLLRVQPGDRLELPPAVRTLLDGHAWLDAVDTAIPNGGCAKLFAAPVSSGVAAIVNALTKERLVMEWSPAENNTLGLWLTRGGWHGHHHFALEPTNGAPDSLAQAAARGRCGLISAFGSVTWSITLRIES